MVCSVDCLFHRADTVRVGSGNGWKEKMNRPSWNWELRPFDVWLVIKPQVAVFDACESACAHCNQESNQLKVYIIEILYVTLRCGNTFPVICSSAWWHNSTGTINYFSFVCMATMNHTLLSAWATTEGTLQNKKQKTGWYNMLDYYSLIY